MTVATPAGSSSDASCFCGTHPRSTRIGGAPIRSQQAQLRAGGQIVVQGVADTAALFVRGEPVRHSIVGGTGIYQNARGDGTVQVPPDVPNETDANIVLNVVTG